MTTRDERMEAAQAFVRSLEQLDPGERAALKRNAGSPLAEARGVPWFYRLLDADGRRNAETYFLIATLYPWNARGANGDLGLTLHRLWLATKAKADRETEKAKSGVARRFNALLDATLDPGGGVAFRLRQLVRLCASKEVGIDWARLLLDLRAWSIPGKPVQRRWAESFYVPGSPDTTDVEASDTTDTNSEKETPDAY
jgi:CRISPR system Cascade subunit CasB